MNAAADILARLEHFGIRLGLETTRRILSALGDPQLAYPVVLVAGTNGKGSTAAYLQSMLRAAGYRTGFYSSPHLESPCERIRIDGAAIAEDRLGDWLAQVVAAGEARNQTAPTYFEALTAAAFAHFAAARVEIAVVEVGMGGRLDATNASSPVLSVVTPISLDHREYLGETLAAIAGEKAGIFRAGVPALSAEQEAEAGAALAGAAAQLGTPFHAVSELVEIAGVEARAWEGQQVTLLCEGRSLRASTKLLGPHQPGNLALAAASALALQRLGFVRLDLEALRRGAVDCRWPGRLEVVQLPRGRRVVLDGAHNPAGVAALAAFLRDTAGPIDLLFGALADKDAADMLPRLLPYAGELTLTAPPSPRALDPRDLAVVAAGRRVRLENDPALALESALAAGDQRRPLLICGSLYLIGDLRAQLRRRYGVPEPASVI
jgi:dihydrofolate synthase/folylpolyglutamate synthase